MQSLFEALRSLPGGPLSVSIGTIFALALFVLLLVEVFRSLRRLRFDRLMQRAALERMRAEVQEIRLRNRDAEQIRLVWSGCRKFTVAKKVTECDEVCAFYLKPHDGKALPAFRPGQYLTFQLDLPGRDKPLVRCYSLSDGPHRTDCFRVTIKKEKSPADKPGVPSGAASSYFCDVVKEGDILNVKAPTGEFFLDMTKTNPVVLIAGGVGITPILAMANSIAASGSKREAWVFFGVRNTREHIHKAELEKLGSENENIHLHVCYSKPGANEAKGRDYQHEGRVTIELIKELLPSNNFEYYLCGNGAFMKSLTEGLEAWGVPKKDVHFEAFGPASIPTPPPPRAEDSSVKVEVTFARSGKTVRWQPSAGNLLEFARAHDVRIEAGCCAGSCGSCNVAIRSGTVDYLKKSDIEPEAGTCLTCVCRPKSDLVLDA